MGRKKKRDNDVYDAISLDTCVMQRNVDGGPAPEAVKKQIADLKNKLNGINI